MFFNYLSLCGFTWFFFLPFLSVKPILTILHYFLENLSAQLISNACCMDKRDRNIVTIKDMFLASNSSPWLIIHSGVNIWITQYSNSFDIWHLDFTLNSFDIWYLDLIHIWYACIMTLCTWILLRWLQFQDINTKLRSKIIKACRRRPRSSISNIKCKLTSRKFSLEKYCLLTLHKWAVMLF